MRREPIDFACQINAADLILQGARADRRMEDVALLYGNSEMSFGELDSFTNRVANAFRPFLGTGDRVLMLLKDSPEFVASFLGIMRLGCVAVPLNTRLAPRDIRFIIDNSQATALVIDAEFVPLYRAAVDGRSSPLFVVVNGEHQSGLTSFHEIVGAASPTACSQPMDPDDMAFWLYSSGTTGTPKAAIHCHGDVVVGDEYMRTLGLGPGERVFASSKLFFAFALGHTVIGGLRAGATVILFDGWPDATAIAEVVERYRPSVMLSVPTFFRNLLRDRVAQNACFRSVRTYLSAGEALPVCLYEGWLAATGAPIIEGIGATETIFMFISGTPAEHRPGATGKPMPYADVRLLDPAGQPVTAVGAIGTVWVKMPSLCRGYWLQPERTTAQFRDGWFRTGDTFSVDAEGWWHYHSRTDDLLKISGQWVSPGEIEKCAERVPGIREAVAIGVENGDGLTRAVLFLVADGDGIPDNVERAQLEQEVSHQLRTTLSIYKCPREMRFVDAIPRTATGKVQRYLLRQQSTPRNENQAERSCNAS